MYNFINTFVAHVLTELGRILPRDLKRAFFMVSVFFAIKKAERPSFALVRKINSLLAAAKVHSKQNLLTLELSNILTHYVWKRFDVNGIVVDGKRISVNELCGLNPEESQSQVVGLSMISQAPSWLKYGSDELMVNDLFLVLKGHRLS